MCVVSSCKALISSKASGESGRWNVSCRPVQLKKSRIDMSSQVANEKALGYVFASISSSHMYFQNRVVVPQTTLTFVIPRNIGVSLSMSRHQNDPSELEPCGIFWSYEPGKLNPRDILLVIEFVEEFGQEGFILCFEVQNTQTTTLLWHANHAPCS